MIKGGQRTCDTGDVITSDVIMFARNRCKLTIR